MENSEKYSKFNHYFWWNFSNANKENRMKWKQQNEITIHENKIMLGLLQNK